MARVFWLSCGSAQHLVPGLTCSLFMEGGWGSKQTGSHFLSQWLIWKKGNCSGGEEKGGKAAMVQDAQAVVDRGCWVVVWR